MNLGRSRPKRFNGQSNLGRNIGMKPEAEEFRNHEEVEDIMQPVTEEGLHSGIEWDLGMKRKLLGSLQLQPPIWNPETKKEGRNWRIIDQCWKDVAQSFGEGITDCSCRSTLRSIISSIKYRVKKARTTGNFVWSLSDSRVRRETLEKLYSDYTWELWRDAEFLAISYIDSNFESEPVSMNGNVQLNPSTDPLCHEMGSSSNNSGQQQMSSQLQTPFFQGTLEPKISCSWSLAGSTECHQRGYTPQPVTVSSLPLYRREQMRESAPPSAFVRYCDPFQQPPPQIPLSTPSLFTSERPQCGYSFPGQPCFPLTPMQSFQQQQEPETVLLDSDSIKSEDNNGVHVRQPVAISTQTVETQTGLDVPTENDNANASDDKQEEHKVGLESFEQTLLKQIKQESDSTQAPVGEEESFTTTRIPNMNAAPSSYLPGTSELGRMNPHMFAPTSMIYPPLPSWNGPSGGPAQSYGFVPSPADMAAFAFKEEMEKQKTHQEFRAFIQQAVEHAQPHVLARLLVTFMDITQNMQQSPFSLPPFSFGGSGNAPQGQGHPHASNNGSFSRFHPPYPHN